MASDRATAPVVGNVLLVAVVVVLGVILLVVAAGLLEGTGAPTGDAQFELRETGAGIELVPLALGTDVTVELNGEPVAEIESDEAGRQVLLPTAPGDRITVISQDGDRSVLLTRQIDERERVGDFVAHYTFEDGPADDRLRDASGNGNHGAVTGDPLQTDREEGAWEFDGGGSSEYVQLDNLTVQGVDGVDEFTIAVAYREAAGANGGGGIDQLIEHTYETDQGNSVEWFLETTDGGSGGIDFAVEYPNEVVSSGAVEEQRRHVVAGTYDGETYSLYVDGEQVATDSFGRVVGMGNACLAADNENGNCRDLQYFNGELYEVRLYYGAFDENEITRITQVMS